MERKDVYKRQVLAEHPADLDEFLNLMKRAGYEVKTVRGGGISFRLTGQGQERFTLSLIHIWGRTISAPSLRWAFKVY